MATQRGPRIVRSGLLEYWDAADRKSYPGSGTAWYDLSGRSKNATLVDGPTFTSNYGGGIVFDGNNDRVNLYTNNADTDQLYSVSAITFSVWFNPTTYFLGARCLFFAGTSTMTNFGPWLFWSIGDSGNARDLKWQICNSFGSRATVSSRNDFIWGENVYATGTYDGSTLNLYINGILRATGTLGGNIFLNTGILLLLGYHTGDSGPWLGNIYSAKIYNRALSATEVLQNFNAQRGRFRI
jgi:hypothetical protein